MTFCGRYVYDVARPWNYIHGGNHESAKYRNSSSSSGLLRSISPFRFSLFSFSFSLERVLRGRSNVKLVNCERELHRYRGYRYKKEKKEEREREKEQSLSTRGRKIRKTNADLAHRLRWNYFAKRSVTVLSD
jgi:hypothetical protein